MNLRFQTRILHIPTATADIPMFLGTTIQWDLKEYRAIKKYKIQYNAMKAMAYKLLRQMNPLQCKTPMEFQQLYT